jgi:hypothetical protein
MTSEALVFPSSVVWQRKRNGLPSRSSQQPARFRPSGFSAAAFVALRAKAGGARRDRTDDLKLAKLALSQLSYGPDRERNNLLALCEAGWWARDELNVRPHAYQACALTT